MPRKNQRPRNKYKIRRETLSKARPNTLTDWQRLTIHDYWEGKCCYCGSDVNVGLDHMVPLSDKSCPGTVMRNMVLACHSCNASKGAKDLKFWLLYHFGEIHMEFTIKKLKSYQQWVDSHQDVALTEFMC